MKLDPLGTIAVAGHSTLSEVSVRTLTVNVIESQEFIHDMLLPTMNMPGLRRHRFSGGMGAFKVLNAVIAKDSYLEVG